MWKFWSKQEKPTDPVDGPQASDPGIRLPDPKARMNYLAGDSAHVRHRSSNARRDPYDGESPGLEPPKHKTAVAKVFAAEKLESGEVPAPLVPIINLLVEPVALFFTNLGEIIVTGMILLLFAVLAYYLSDWAQLMFRDLY